MLELNFVPESDKFNSATREYSEIWSQEKYRILEAFLRITGLHFLQKQIEIIVYEGISTAGNLVTPMKLRASNSYVIKKGTLIHELGHRLTRPLRYRLEGLDEEQILYLFLYDVWQYLYGKEFADIMVKHESSYVGRYDYNAAWKWALTMTNEERKDLFEKMKLLNKSNS